MRIHTGAKLQCDHCDQTFIYSNALNRHKKKEHPNVQPSKVSIKFEPTIDDLEAMQHLEMVKPTSSVQRINRDGFALPPKPQSCKLCQITFDDPESLKEHKKSEHSTRFACSICKLKAVFNQRQSWRRHMKTKHPDLFNASLNNQAEMEPVIIRQEDSVSDMLEPAVHIKEEPIDTNEIEALPHKLDEDIATEPYIKQEPVNFPQDSFSDNLGYSIHEDQEEEFDNPVHMENLDFSVDENRATTFLEKVNNPISNVQDIHFVDISEPQVQVKDEPLDEI